MAEQQQQGIGMRQAVDIAFKTLRELYEPAQLEDVMLEEVLLNYPNPEKEEWEVTVGFTRPYSSTRPGAVGNVFPQAKPRAYKRFLIDANTGNVIGMVEGRVDID